MRSIEVIIKADEEKILPFVFIDSAEKINLTAHLAGKGASLQIVGIFLGHNTQSVLFKTNVIHEASQTKSRTTIRGVFFNSSSFDNDGIVRIIKGAKGADGFFSSKILLFDHAKGRSIPSLEIDENEVKAGHASTVGRLDPSQLFYLQSRGLSRREAEYLMITGFFESVMVSLPKKERIISRRKITQLLSRHSQSQREICIIS
ncbi:MAG: SufD family Fe-S cluster assembly protein [Candidatus Levybacteria bacterium]|nr:SufD family Fe-S cluster assembly protein [Candidatus Levybacteria bacterium]